MRSIFRRHGKSPRQELRDMLSGYELPSFHSAVLSVLSMLRDPDSSLTEIAMQLQIDPGMHVKVLKTVNSAAFGLMNEVSNIPHAVTLLGRSRLESLVLSVAVKDVLPSDELQNFDVRQFWLSAAMRATLARVLAQNLHPATQAESFTAGLLQDIAVPVLVSVKRNTYCAIYEEWKKGSDSRLDILEKESFGYDHQTVGALMIEEWNLPEYLARMISAHHNWDNNTEVEPAVRLVSLIRDGNHKESIDTLIETCQKDFGLNQDIILKLTEKAFEDAEEFSQILR